jgi:phospholipid transport system transporter-binding protein
MPAIALPAAANLPVAAALADTLGAALDEALRTDAGPVRLDASALQDVDSSTLALLLQLRRRAQAAGRALVLDGAPAKLHQLAQLYGVDALVGAAATSGASAPGPST